MNHPRSREENEIEINMALSEDENELGSVSEDNPIHGIIDDLYILKHSIVKNNKLVEESPSFLNQIHNVVEDFPELANNLFEWKFLEREILYLLRSPLFPNALKTVTLIISTVNKAPRIFFTKKFLFFITEKLYSAMGGRATPKKKQLMDIQMIYSGQPISDQGVNEPDYPTIKLIMPFFKKLIEINRLVVISLYEISFFDLANACMCVETVEMFSQVFSGLVYSEHVEEGEKHSPWIRDGLYEIRRKFFEPEIIFRNKDVFISKSVVEKAGSVVLNKIYTQCTNVKDFADLSFTAALDLLLYKRISYFSDEFEPLILEGKNPKVMRFYRRALEAGQIPDKAYMNSIIKAVDHPETARDASIILYYYIEFIVENRLITESRIRSIIQTLEYRCEHDCKGVHRSEEPVKIVSKTAVKPLDSSLIHSFDSNMCTNGIFGDTCNDGLFSTPRIFTEAKSHRSVLEDLSEFVGPDNCTEESKGTQQTAADVEFCDRYRILKVVEHLFTISNPLFFFKPSFMILFRAALVHVPTEINFLNDFFRRFLEYLNSNEKNIAKVLLPVSEPTRRVKMVELKIEDDPVAEIIVYREEEKEANMKENLKENAMNLRINRGMIESDEE